MKITTTFNIGRLQKQNLELIMSELQMENSSIISAAGLTYLLNLDQFSDAGFQLRVNILQTTAHLKYEYIVSR